MKADHSTCASVQLAMVGGTDTEGDRAHLDLCEECRFFVSLCGPAVRSRLPIVPVAVARSSTLVEVLRAARDQGKPVAGRYCPERPLGSDNDVQVWRAIDLETGRPTAVRFAVATTNDAINN